MNVHGMTLSRREYGKIKCNFLNPHYQQKRLSHLPHHFIHFLTTPPKDDDMLRALFQLTSTPFGILNELSSIGVLCVHSAQTVTISLKIVILTVLIHQSLLEGYFHIARRGLNGVYTLVYQQARGRPCCVWVNNGQPR